MDARSEGPVFAAPSLEGAARALRDLFRGDGREDPEKAPRVKERRACAVAIDVLAADGVLLQRALAHADVPRNVRDAFRELVDRTITRFAESQRLDAMRGGDPYRGGALASNDFAGFDVGYASAVARDRIAKLRGSLRSSADLDIRLYAVPFLHLVIDRRDPSVPDEEVVVLRAEDGAYVHEAVAQRGPIGPR